MRAIWAMVKKDMTQLVRDRMGFFFTFGFPLIMAVFFGTIFAGSSSETREMSVVVVDEDQTPGSHAFFRQLEDGPEFRADSMGLADAREAVRLGKRTAFLVLPKGFAASRQRMFYGAAPEIQLGLGRSHSRSPLPVWIVQLNQHVARRVGVRGHPAREFGGRDSAARVCAGWEEVQPLAMRQVSPEAIAHCQAGVLRDECGGSL